METKKKGTPFLVGGRRPIRRKVGENMDGSIYVDAYRHYCRVCKHSFEQPLETTIKCPSCGNVVRYLGKKSENE